jgi:hypothetical protein
VEPLLPNKQSNAANREFGPDRLLLDKLARSVRNRFILQIDLGDDASEIASSHDDKHPDNAVLLTKFRVAFLLDDKLPSKRQKKKPRTYAHQ